MISPSREDVRQLQTKLRFGNDIILLQDSVGIFGVEVDSCVRFDRHFQKMAHKLSHKVTLLRRMKHFLD